MLVLFREAIVDNFAGSAISEEWNGIRARLGVRFETVVGAACLAVALFVADGYPRLAMLSAMSLCAHIWILRACRGE